MVSRSVMVVVFEPDLEAQRLLCLELKQAGLLPIAVDNVESLLTSLKSKPDAVLTDNNEHIQKVVSLAQEHSETAFFLLLDPPYAQWIDQIQSLDNAKILTKPLTLRDIVNAIKANLADWRYGSKNSDEIQNAVRVSIDEVIGFYVEQNLFYRSLKKRKIDSSQVEYLGWLRFSGRNVIGSIALYLDKPMIKTLANAMMGMEMDEMSDEEYCDIVSELCNQIGGILKEKLREAGIEANIGLPLSLADHGLHLCHPGSGEVGCLQISTKPPSWKEKIFGQKSNTIEYCFSKVG